jgi:hypothetical protein
MKLMASRDRHLQVPEKERRDGNCAQKKTLSYVSLSHQVLIEVDSLLDNLPA